MRDVQRVISNRSLALIAAGGVTAFGIGALLAHALRPIDTSNYVSRPQPTESYDQAIARFTQLRLREDSNIAPYGRSLIYDHGQQTEHAIVLIHGLTNCPNQYIKLAPLLHAQGANVIVPRMPQHGLADRNTHALAQLTTQELCEFADQVADIAAGLGRQATVAGISAGGVIAAWLAQFRPDFGHAVMIAPAFRVNSVPPTLNNVAMKLFTRWPDLHLISGSKLPTAYAADSTRGFGAVMVMGEATLRAAHAQPATARSVCVITNAVDTIDNRPTTRLLERWHKHGLQTITTYEFPAEEQLIHDVIDPSQAKQRTDLVYPVLIDAILERHLEHGSRL